MMKVKIFGAGSIGNHLAFACRNKNWGVTMVDIDRAALERTKNEIYPSRYGKWDPEIQLGTVAETASSTERYDLVILGTPPESHIPLALEILRKAPPKVLLVEKPLCTPSMDKIGELIRLAKDTGTHIAVAYNHTLTQNTKLAHQLLANGTVGQTLTIQASFREHWGGIFRAHPWLNGPKDTYLGFTAQGGGASGEHSHAINIWQHFALAVGAGRVTEVTAMLDWVKDGAAHYDRICQLSVRTEKGLVGEIAQDVITDPAEKTVRIQGTTGFIEWFVNRDKQSDMVRYSDGKTPVQEKSILKTRPDDFKGEIDHIEDLLTGKAKISDSPIAFERGLETMLVVIAAQVSSEKKRAVRINYEKGYTPEAIELT
jgi:predicted dehydrogenase